MVDAPDTPADTGPLPAGRCSTWLRAMREALRGAATTDVPCHGCTACCTSSQFVPIGPDETETLARIPAELRFPAPRRPAGHVVLGYDEHGRCPMLGEHGCSIYEHRPRACRTYDCRVFAAAGVEPDDARALVARRARRWRFDLSTAADRAALAAVRAAAREVLDEARAPGGSPPTPVHVAVAAVERSEAFLRPDPTS